MWTKISVILDCRFHPTKQGRTKMPDGAEQDIQQQKKWDDAIELLKDISELNPDGLHPRDGAEQDISAAEEMERSRSDSVGIRCCSMLDNLQGRTELSKICQQQKKWKEAEAILLESLAIDAEQLHPRTKLKKICEQQKKMDDAIRLLKEYIELDPDGFIPGRS